MTNSEKQERYRRKEALKRMAFEASRMLNDLNYLAQGKNPAETIKRLEALADLPANWTDEDYNHAEKCIQNISREFYDNPYLLGNDLHDNHESVESFSTTLNPHKYVSDLKTAKTNSRKLANTILSSIDLSGLSTADATATVVDVLRMLGRMLMDSKQIPKSMATALAIALIGQQYPKPEWLIGKLTTMLGKQLGEETAHKLGESLMQFKIFA